MNCHVFQSWFGGKLIPNFPKGRKTLLVIDNAIYHCRLMEKTPLLEWNQYQQNHFYSALSETQMF